MTVITSVRRWLVGIWLVRSAKALRASYEAIRWRRRILRALDQRRRD